MIGLTVLTVICIVHLGNSNGRLRVKVRHPERLLLAGANNYRGPTKRTEFKKISIRSLAAKGRAYGGLSPYPSPRTVGQSCHFPLQHSFWSWCHVSHKAEFQQFLSKTGFQKMNRKILSQVSETSCVKVLFSLLIYRYDKYYL